VSRHLSSGNACRRKRLPDRGKSSLISALAYRLFLTPSLASCFARTLAVRGDVACGLARICDPAAGYGERYFTIGGKFFINFAMPFDRFFRFFC
jgi:hypothetical protein